MLHSKIKVRLMGIILGLILIILLVWGYSYFTEIEWRQIDTEFWNQGMKYQMSINIGKKRYKWICKTHLLVLLNSDNSNPLIIIEAESDLPTEEIWKLE